MALDNDMLLTFAGTPVYPVRGGIEPGEGEEVGGGAPAADDDGDDNDDTGQGDPAAGDDDDDDADDKPLGPKGQKALDAERDRADREKGKARTAREALKPWLDLEKRFGKLEDIQARLEGKVKDADGKEVDVADLRRTIEAEVHGKYQGQLNDSLIEKLAADTFHNAADALTFIDRSALDTDSTGKLDEKEVRDALADVLTARPYLGKTTKPGKPKAPSGGRGQGSGADEKPTGGSIQAGMTAWKNTAPRKPAAAASTR